MPSAYRPISLANSSSELYAVLLQARLAYHFDDRISDFQYGFRKRGPRVLLSSLSGAWLNSLNGIPHSLHPVLTLVSSF